MYARVSISSAQPDRKEAVIGIHRDSVVPACEQENGFKGLYLLQDPATGKGMTITLWETEADMTAGESSGFYQQQVAKFKGVLSGPVVREAYEVSLHP
jgi:heme-degrading monooxygenase HmoA